MYDVTALGELLIDFVQNGESEQGNRLFEASPGGAPCNALAMVNRLGHRAAFIGKVGRDSFGDLLERTLEDVGIETKGLKRDEEARTTLAFVHTLADGDRDFSFYRKNGADTRLLTSDIELSLIEDCQIFHFGTLSLTDEPAKTATEFAVNRAKELGKLISFDPNYRPLLWGTQQQAKDAAWYGIENCDILKIADNEIIWLTGKEDYDEGVAELRKRSGAKLINVTLGRDGCRSYYAGEEAVFVPAFINEAVVDTTGAGDCFCGSVLSYIAEHGLDGLERGQIEEMVTFANAAASIVTTKKGAIRSMPTRKETEERMRRSR